jgi:hypothetical protein
MIWEWALCRTLKTLPSDLGRPHHGQGYRQKPSLTVVQSHSPTIGGNEQQTLDDPELLWSHQGLHLHTLCTWHVHPLIYLCYCLHLPTRN